MPVETTPTTHRPSSPVRFCKHPTRPDFRVVLICAYEMGRQPFGLASPAAWLKSAGFTVTTVDASIQSLPETEISAANFIAFYLPMHTATRLACKLIPQIRQQNKSADLGAYGLYAPLNAEYLKELGVDFILGGEFEADLLRICRQLAQGESGDDVATATDTDIPRIQFQLPDRSGLPEPAQYAQLVYGETIKPAGYVEASRGCKHLCRHCPIVPVYKGRFRIVQPDVVLADIRQQVEAGVRHITFGDPDFFNGIGHAIPIVQRLNREFPDITYDVTIKIEHLLKHRRHLGELRNTGCILITSAVESFDNTILQILQKGHTFSDFEMALSLLRKAGIPMQPTFIPFTPWASRKSYLAFLQTLCDLDLVANISPVQFSIRLLLPNGSLLTDIPEMKPHLESFSNEHLAYKWRHPDAAMDELQLELSGLISTAQAAGQSRHQIFEKVWKKTAGYLDWQSVTPDLDLAPDRATIPYLNEPWYC